MAIKDDLKKEVLDAVKENVKEKVTGNNADKIAENVSKIVSGITNSATESTTAAIKNATAPLRMQVVGIIAAVVVVVLLVAFLIINPFGWNLSLKFWDRGVKIEETANVVEKVRKISEFTTSCYYEEYVLKSERLDTNVNKGWFREKVDTTFNEIVLTVKGAVRAGFDLSKLKEGDFVAKGDTVNIKLPAPEIFDVISNPSDYKIFEENGKWKHEEIVELQSDGKMRVLNNAIQAGILEKANNVGKERVADLLKAFGFTVVNVTLMELR